MRIYQLRELAKEELLQKKFELQEELFNLRLTALVKKLDNPSKLKNLRRDIARINTLLGRENIPSRQSQTQAPSK
ncbi:MAG: 50S ribosomal protein L29 [candidate division Zixibacteria bacterium RBG_16_50_21]|nr:MAG: 50S ribosomal protein L29 [candidate division Zixibacteria bacterium RBG_16_50_21]